MAHYALLNGANFVVQVVVGSGDDLESYYAELMGLTCKRTSYNTQGGVHSAGGTPFRKNYAGIGYTYDAARDAFIPPKPYPSWVLVEESCLWESQCLCLRMADFTHGMKAPECGRCYNGGRGNRRDSHRCRWI